LYQLKVAGEKNEKSMLKHSGEFQALEKSFQLWSYFCSFYRGTCRILYETCV